MSILKSFWFLNYQAMERNRRTKKAKAYVLTVTLRLFHSLLWLCQLLLLWLPQVDRLHNRDERRVQKEVRGWQKLHIRDRPWPGLLCGKQEQRNKPVQSRKRDGREWGQVGGQGRRSCGGGGGGGRANEEVKEWIGRVTWHRWSPGLCVCVMSMVGCWSAHVENLKQKKPQCGWRRGRSRYGHNNTFRADVGKSMCVHTQAHGPGDSVSRNCHSERRLCWVPSCVPED